MAGTLSPREGRRTAALFEESGPLAPGHESRRPVYQLWPALVRFRLFGNAYRPLLERLPRAAGV